MKFFRISSLVQVPEENIEAVCTFDSLPIKRFVSNAKQQGRCFPTSASQRSVRSIILTTDGKVYTAMYYPKTYIRKLENPDFFRTDTGSYIDQRKVTMIVNKKNKSFTRYFDARNTDGYCLNLARHRGVGNYLVTVSGMVYACHMIRDENDEKEDMDHEEI